MIELKFMTDFQHLHNVTRAKESFEKINPGVRILIEQATDHFETLRAYQSDEAPDMIESGGWALFNKQGMFVDLSPYVRDVPGLEEDLNPGIMRVARKDGTLPGLPIDVSIPLMVINKKMFDQAGLAYPTDDWTWDEMIQLAKRMTLRNEDGVAIQFGLGIGTDIEENEPFIMRNGGRYLSPDGATARNYIDSAATIEAFRKIVDAFRKDHVIRKPGEPSKAGDLHQGFAIALGFTWYIGNLVKHNFAEQFEVVGLPRMPGGELSNMIYMGAAGVTSKSQHPKLGWEFLRHYILERPESFQAPMTLPITKSLAVRSGMTQHRLWSRYIQELDSVQVSGFYQNEKWNSSRQLINEDIHRMILENADVAQMLKSWIRYA
jgi:multiple sugar transport system substrate-binding protein